MWQAEGLQPDFYTSASLRKLQESLLFICWFGESIRLGLKYIIFCRNIVLRVGWWCDLSTWNYVQKLMECLGNHSTFNRRRQGWMISPWIFKTIYVPKCKKCFDIDLYWLRNVNMSVILCADDAVLLVKNPDNVWEHVSARSMNLKMPRLLYLTRTMEWSTVTYIQIVEN